MTSELNDGQIIERMALVYQDYISSRSSRNLANITKAIPGMSAKSMEVVIKNLDILLEGGMLVMSGRVGCGKTTAATAGALLYQHFLRHKGMEIKYRRSLRFKIIPSRSVIKAPFSDYPEEFNEYEHLLVIEDLGREHFTDKGFGIAEWDFLFDNRYSSDYPAIITTNLKSDEFVEVYNTPILDRLKECAVWEQITDESLRRKRTKGED